MVSSGFIQIEKLFFVTNKILDENIRRCFFFFLSLFNRNCKIKETKKRLICIFIVGVTCKEKSESLKNGNDKVGRSTSHKNIILNVSVSLLDFIYIFYIKLNFFFVRSFGSPCVNNNIIKTWLLHAIVKNTCANGEYRHLEAIHFIVHEINNCFICSVVIICAKINSKD